MVLLGYFLGGVPIVRHNFEKVVLLIIVVSILPPLIQALKGRKSKQAVGAAR
jgi:membrane-associated protein